MRGICILLVVFLHTTTSTRDWAGLNFSHSITVFNEFMDPFRIPLLMFLSGMLLHKSLNKSTSEYFWGKFHLIFWPFLIWSMAVYAAEDRLTLSFILKTVISAPSVLWYLWFLCAFYLLALLLHRISAPLLPVIVICLIASVFLPSVLRMDRFSFLFAFFLLGHYASVRSLRSKMTLPIAVGGLAAAVTGGIISGVGDSIKYDFMFAWAPLGLMIFVLWASPLYKPKAASAYIEWVGRNSIVFYVVHFPVLVVLGRILSGVTEWNGTVFYFVVFLLTLMTAIIVQLVRERSVVVAALFDFRRVLTIYNSARRKLWRPQKKSQNR